MRMVRLDLHERAKWGLCPDCGAKHGQPCDIRTKDVDNACVHLSRLVRAPETVPVQAA